MQIIDRDSWNRAHLFELYEGTDLPYIILDARVDVTRLYRYAKAEGLSFYFALIHTAQKVANSIENFRYRFSGPQVLLIDRGAPILTYLAKGEEIFTLLEAPWRDAPADFCRTLRGVAENRANWFDARSLKGRLDITYYSCIPWVDYTHIFRTIGKAGADCNPKLSWGKFTTDAAGRTSLTFSVQVHHGLMDGYHVGLFYQRLQEALNRF